jgi:hypothetical protein
VAGATAGQAIDHFVSLFLQWADSLCGAVSVAQIQILSPAID